MLRGDVDCEGVNELLGFPEIPDPDICERELRFVYIGDDGVPVHAKVVPSSAGDPDWPWAVAKDESADSALRTLEK